MELLKIMNYVRNKFLLSLAIGFIDMCIYCALPILISKGRFTSISLWITLVTITCIFFICIFYCCYNAILYFMLIRNKMHIYESKDITKEQLKKHYVLIGCELLDDKCYDIAFIKLGLRKVIFSAKEV